MMQSHAKSTQARGVEWLGPLTRRSRRWVTLLGLASIVLLGVLDYVTGPRLSFSLFYLVPISLGAWSAGKRVGLFLSLTSALSWLTADLISGFVSPSDFVPYWNFVVRSGVFTIVAFLISLLRELNEQLEERVRQRTQSLTEEIAERKRSEKALGEAEARYRTTLDHMLEGCLIISFDWRFLYVNEVAATQGRRRRNELLGHTMMEIYPGIEKTEMFATIQRCMENKTPAKMDNEFTFPDGARGWFNLSIEPVPEGVFILSEDITKEKQLDEELRAHREHLEELVEERTEQLAAANRELEAFSYSVSHDLRAPLRAIHGFSGILQEEYAATLDSEGRRLLDVIGANTIQMGRLIDDLLTFSRLGRNELDRATINLNQLVQSVTEECLATRGLKRPDITIQDLPTAEGDLAMLRQVFTNLISNAIKFTSKSPNPKIAIGSATSDGGITYFVKDNGVGFDMQYADKLFGVFQRLHKTDEFEGTGVGLAIVQRIIHRHGGRIWAEAELNNGATFHFTIPRNTHAKY